MQNNESQMKTRFQTTDQAWSKSQFGIMHFFEGENSQHFHSTCIFTERHVLLFTTLLIQCSNKRFAAWEIHYEFSSHHVQKLASATVNESCAPFRKRSFFPAHFRRPQTKRSDAIYYTIGYLIKRARTSKWQDKSAISPLDVIHPKIKTKQN